MTTITLPPDIEGALHEAPRRRGTTPERLALEGVRQLVAPPAAAPAGGTLHDFLSGHIGTVAGSGEALSDDCGRRFAEGLEKPPRREPS